MFGLRSDIAHPDVMPMSRATSRYRRMESSQGSVSQGPRRLGGKCTECGDASACLKLRIPLTRRDPHEVTSKAVPDPTMKNGRKTRTRAQVRPEVRTDA